MDSKCAWEIFMQTGAPEMYLLYSELKGKEGANVSQGARTCTAGDQLQGP